MQKKVLKYWTKKVSEYRISYNKFSLSILYRIREKVLDQKSIDKKVPVGDPEDFCPVPDPTFENVWIRILTWHAATSNILKLNYKRQRECGDSSTRILRPVRIRFSTENLIFICLTVGLQQFIKLET
jgi:hypothetical protein